MEQIFITDSANALVNKLNHNFAETSTNVGDDWQVVHLGNLVKDGNWVKQKDNVCNVADGVTYAFKMPSDVVAKISYGSNVRPNTTSSNIFNGETFTFPSGANTQKIYFAKYASGAVTNITLAEAESLIASGDILITCKDLGVVERNADKDNLFAVAKRVVKDAVVRPTTVNMAPIIGHISDLHGDIQRAYNYFKYCKWKGVDDCVVSGDTVMANYSDGLDYLFAAAAENDMHVTCVMGNHEASGITASEGIMFSTFLGPYADGLGYLKAADTVTDRGYYYHDLTSKSLRIIVLDQYDGGVYGGQGKGGRISQGQIDFLISALSNTPAGYGVIITMHAQEDAITMPTTYAKFISSRASSYTSSGFYVDTSRPIKHIVDAFIGRTTYTGGYTLTYGGTTETVTINADFSSVDSSVEFICYLTGHRHRDFIGYVNDTTYPQLLIQTTSGNALAVTSDSIFASSAEDDLPRFGWGATQDAFNIYAIDRNAKDVRIVRIGSSMNYEFRERDYLVASYATIPNS